MTAQMPRLAAALLLLTLVAGGCTLGRGTRTTTVAPREQPNATMMAADLEGLRLENERLRAQQGTLESRLEEVQRKLTQSQEEQRRFRESMVTNFDLLEQSVALTLSKTITADLNARAAEPAPAAGSPAAGTRPDSAQAAQTRTARHAAPIAAPIAAPTAQPAARPMQAALVQDGASSDGVSAAAMGRSPAGDPDLLPPQNPTKLSAHREAKALYEKGFALFARKDYDAAVIVFQNFLKRYPDDIYSDNAQFWVAESYAGMNRPQEAEQAYRAVLRNYEHRSTLEGYKTPDAIYRLGQTYLNQGEAGRARQYFEALGERFPDTSAGRKAVRELSTLGINTAAR